MNESNENFAYIDGANLHNALKDAMWELDYQRFYIWLSEKYSVHKAYIFIGYLEKNTGLYTYLERCGFTLIFKEVAYNKNGEIKGNCDADLVLHAVQNAYEYPFSKAVLVSSDGDYASLATFLKIRVQLEVLLSPNQPEKCSILLKRTGAPIVYVQDNRSYLEVINEKAPDADGTA